MSLLLARIAQAHRLAPTGGDPYFSSVIGLLSFQGPNNSTVFTDSSNNPQVWSGVNGASLSTATKKWGTSSLFCNGGYINCPTMAAMGSGDFTIEGWFYTTDIANTRGLFASDAPSNVNQIALGADPVSTHLDQYLAGTVNSINYTFVNKTWTHIAMVRSANKVTTYINGIAKTPTKTDSQVKTEQNWCVGEYYDTGNFPWIGYIGEMRFTKGVARYTAAFSPPTAAFPNH